MSAKAARELIEKMRLHMKVDVAMNEERNHNMVPFANDVTDIIFAFAAWLPRERDREGANPSPRIGSKAKAQESFPRASKSLRVQKHAAHAYI